MASNRKPRKRPTNASSAAPRSRSYRGWTALENVQCQRWASVIVILHASALALSFDSIYALFGNQPLIDQDWGLHFHHLKSLEAYWSDGRSIWGYNPYFMAGYPSNTIQDLSVKFFEFAALGLSAIALEPIQWFKITAFLAMVSLPWLSYASAANFFHNHEAKNQIALLSASLGTLYWWNSLPREMFFYGMIGFPVAAYLSVWGLSLCYRLVMESPRPGLIHVGWLVFAAVVLMVHVQSLVILVPPMLVLLIIQMRRMTGRLLCWLAAALAIGILANLPWLLIAFNHRHNDVSTAIVNQLPLFASSDPFTFLIDYLGTKGYWTFRPSFVEKGFRLALLVLGVLGVIECSKKDQRHVGTVLTAGFSSLFLLTYFGAFIPMIAAWQPLRFKVPLDLFLAIGAAYGINQWLTGQKTSRFHLVPAMISMGALAFVINVVQTESTGKLQSRTTMGPEIISIIDWIARETTPDARVLFEESGDETGFVYDGMYLSAFLPHLTGRQLIGGPINLYNDRHHFAEFHSGKLFQRDIGTISDDALRNYLRLYNIGAVVAFHPASVKRLLSIPGFVTVDQRVGPIQLMKVNQPLSWLAEGEGKVKAGADRLELTDLKGREVVLKYHWVEGLRATPAVKILPVQIADDPIPFIKLIDPPASLVLRVH